MKKRQSLIRLALFAGILLFINIIASFFHAHLDLTEEKRFTLTRPTKALLGNLKDVVNVKILLDGDFPAGFKRLQTSTRELLDDMRGQSKFIEYQFENPNAGSVQQINDFRKNLAEQNINPLNLRVMENDQMTEKLIYPVAILAIGTRQVTVNLLEGDSPNQDPETVLNNAVSQLEYKFANAIQKLKTSSKPAILFVKGHGEIVDAQIGDFTAALNPFYNLGTISLDSVAIVRPEVALLVVAKPEKMFSERDKFKLDQYVMGGGKILWFIDRMGVSLDSMSGGRQFIPQDLPLGLEDIFFKYGVRILPNLILDLQNSKIPITVGQVGNKPQIELFPWFYHPAVAPSTGHPIVKNLDRVALYFPSTIDTIRTKTAVKKTVLLSSSKYSRVQSSPIELSFEILRYPDDPSKFTKGAQPVAVLLDGVFPSLFEGRLSAEMNDGLQKMGTPFRAQSQPTRQIIISDGDVASCMYNKKKGKYEPLGINVFEKEFGNQTYPYANKAFVLNCVEYLLDPNGIIEARSKEIKLRLLDKTAAVKNRGFWQILNIGLPLLILSIFGLAFGWWRRRKFAK
jgi:ABC-2 type transport system permease protein